MQLQYKLTYEDYIAAQALHARREAAPYLSYVLCRYGYFIFGILVWAHCIATAAMRHWAKFDWAVFAFGAFWIAITLYVRFAYWRVFHRCMNQDGEAILNFDSDLIRCQSTHTRSEVEWAAIQRSAEDKKAFLLYLASARFMIIPKHVCTPEQIEELHRLLQSKVSAQHENRP